MSEYEVAKAHYNGKVQYIRGQDFPQEGDKLPGKQDLEKKIASGLIKL